MINNIPLLSTDIKRKFKDSGTLVQRNSGNLTSGSIFAFELDKRFQPYDDVTVINLNSDNDCTIFINGKSIQQPLPKGVATPLNHSAIRDLEIKNIGSSTISANEIEIYYRHTTKEGEKQLETASNLSSIAFAVRSFIK